MVRLDDIATIRRGVPHPIQRDGNGRWLPCRQSWRAWFVPNERIDIWRPKAEPMYWPSSRHNCLRESQSILPLDQIQVRLGPPFFARLESLMIGASAVVLRDFAL